MLFTSVVFANLLTLAVADYPGNSTANTVFPLPSAGDCIDKCNTRAGQMFDKSYTTDPSIPYFIDSLDFECNLSNPKRSPFFTQAGICMMSCSSSQQHSYENQYEQKCQWWYQATGTVNDITVTGDKASGKAKGDAARAGFSSAPATFTKATQGLGTLAVIMTLVHLL
ncbi:hypothetical protein K7432_010422 [Basidiobolus ranarum]|uniref:Uncharacterized protein n=1 Tax=Basidiobolus ranarum TaxID=34480 RepID=A0ABR2WNV2_9FUNG